MNALPSISFLPDDYLAEKRLRRTNLICAVAFLVVACGISAAFILRHERLARVEQRHAEVSRRYAEASRRIDQVRLMQEQQRKIARQAELTGSLLEKLPRSFLLAEITNALPEGVSLVDLGLESRLQAAPAAAPTRTAFEKRAAAASAADNAGPRRFDAMMRITGIADTDMQVAQLMNRLSRSALLNDINLVVSDQLDRSDSRLRKFQIEMKVNPAATAPHGQRDVKTASLDTGDRP